MHVAIAGNIGSGKTSLTKKLASHFDYFPEYEEADKNPFIEDFYQNMKKWAFHLQVYFLTTRFNQLSRIKYATHPVIQDRTIYEDAYIFAENLYRSKLLSDREFQTYKYIFNSMTGKLAPPDLLIFLKADISRLIENIKTRGKSYEKGISIEYLENLNVLYKEWIDNYNLGKLLVIDVNQLDFINNTNDWQTVLGLIESQLIKFKQ